MLTTKLAIFSSWALVALAVLHVVFGLIKFRAPLMQAISAGFIGQFALSESRRTAFWFVMFGLLLLLVGHIAVRAAVAVDLALLGLVGSYVFAISLIGVAAFPRSPFPLSLFIAALLLLASFGL